MKVDFTIMLLKTFKANFISNSIHYTPHIHSLSAWMALHYKTSRGLAIMSVGPDPYNSSVLPWGHFAKHYLCFEFLNIPKNRKLMRVVKGGPGSRFTKNKMAISLFTGNKMAISR